MQYAKTCTDGTFLHRMIYKTACKHQVKWTDEIKKQLEKYVDFIERDVPTIDVDYEDLSEKDIHREQGTPSLIRLFSFQKLLWFLLHQ